ncbi:hypothetical protein B7486_10050 [cyanobacterium TDX16]|nr:hypothetical protein B7486_10050 [cyanobacterium TDX16]
MGRIDPIQRAWRFGFAIRRVGGLRGESGDGLGSPDPSRRQMGDPTSGNLRLSMTAALPYNPRNPCHERTRPGAF